MIWEMTMGDAKNLENYSNNSPEKAVFDNFEVEHNFLTIGKRIMLLNARQIETAFGKDKIILLAIEDVTGRKQDEKSYTRN